MKIFHLGAACGHSEFEEIVSSSKIAPSRSAQNFESAFLNGLARQDGVDFVANSFYSIAPFPKGCYLKIKGHKEKIEDCKINILPMINLLFIKQLCMSVVIRRRLTAWLKQNSEETEKCVTLYGLYPATAGEILKVCNKYHCKVFAFVTDAPRMMYSYAIGKSKLKCFLQNIYKKKAIKLQSKFDGYIFITEAMSKEIAPGKPFTVLEVICDEHIFDEVSCVKDKKKAIMYAGTLNKLFGIEHILDSFDKLNGDYQLWLFGDGDMSEIIKEKSNSDQRIKYFGRCNRKTVLEYEKRASLLVNIRDTCDEYTRFSFPSKMIEYMLSGTPMLTTKLPGIPCEYFEYVYVADNTDSRYLARLISDILLDEKKLEEMGEKAKQFVQNNKTATLGAKKVLSFIQSQI